MTGFQMVVVGPGCDITRLYAPASRGVLRSGVERVLRRGFAA
ncbi:MAG TPA: hypothetical protein VFM63_07750 [Pyrinomonadaceae bacterium]|nr:hypothetical protein [Pyrinomonadaceae bacterium]